MKFRVLAVAVLCGAAVFADWGKYLDPPAGYASFPRTVEKVATYRLPEMTVEEYRQANGPGTFQRLMIALPAKAKGRLPAVVVTFYYPEAMLAFNPVDGGVKCHLTSSKRTLAHYKPIAYMSDLVKRGYVTVCAEPYYLNYDAKGGRVPYWGNWKKAAERLGKDCPSWTGIGKLAFDTRLLVDLLSADPRVDPDRIGITGHSLGGKMAFYTGCLDKRIKVIVASDFGMDWDRTNWKDTWYWGDKLKEVRAKGMDHSGLLSLAGGKPFCLIAGRDDNAKSEAIMRRAKGYEKHPERLEFINHGKGHRPPRDVTEAGYRFLDRYLKNAVVTLTASDTEIVVAPDAAPVTRFAAKRLLVKGAERMKPNTRYRLSFFVKCENVKGVRRNGGVSLCFHDNIDRAAPRLNFLTGTTDWVHVSIESLSKKNTNRCAPAFVQPRLTNAMGTVWFDDILIEEVKQ